MYCYSKSFFNAISFIAVFAVLGLFGTLSALSASNHEPISSSHLARRQKGDQRPRYLALSSKVTSELTLLQLKNSTLLTAGSASSYSSTKLPPPGTLEGLFNSYDENVFAPGNIGIRRYNDRWELGVFVLNNDFNKCLHATLKPPNLFVGKCPNATLENKEMTWVNWGPQGDRGNGGFFLPYGRQKASDFVNGNSPSFKKSWGLSRNQNWKTTGKPIKISNEADDHAHLTIFHYEGDKPLVTTCYEELR
ncbi:hypothetical protein O181_005722 [Austropuccinia psidii MF-1]|uniref:Uncharacterized protein n=1 Tax=Austropuccinia psidii MF-1 TaxID=1389203 RepID=A0A9Q3BJB0_9BASI|nr:hypothetical protein [Austropuccinia psidii MF-1]